MSPSMIAGALVAALLTGWILRLRKLEAEQYFSPDTWNRCESCRVLVRVWGARGEANQRELNKHLGHKLHGPVYVSWGEWVRLVLGVL